MALRSGAPVAAGATALFVLALQRPPQRLFRPADFRVTGAFGNSSASVHVRVAPFPGRGWATRVAVDLPAGFCGRATLALRDPGLIRLAGGGELGACGRDAAAVTWTRACGPAAKALVLQSGAEVVDVALAEAQCVAPVLA